MNRITRLSRLLTASKFNGYLYKVDRHKAAHLTVEDQDHSIFASKLDATLDQIVDAGLNSAWLSLELTNQSSLVGPALARKFECHHVSGTRMVLNKWLVAGIKSRLPGYNTHLLGSGGIVLDKNMRNILLVKERVSGDRIIWKLPGGQVESREWVADGAVREILEETGIQAEFKEVVCFREIKDFRFGGTDVYYVCLLEAITEDINFCKDEVIDCKWWDIDEAFSGDIISFSHPIYRIMRQAVDAKRGKLEIPKTNNGIFFNSKVFEYGQRIQTLHYPCWMTDIFPNN